MGRGKRGKRKKVEKMKRERAELKVEESRKNWGEQNESGAEEEARGREERTDKG